MLQQIETQHSQLLVLTNHSAHFSTLTALLSQYFPHPHPQPQYLQVTTKYYSATVKLVPEAWPQQEQVQQHKPQSAEIQGSAQNKKDMLIMLVAQNESLEVEVYDYVISKYNPQNFILIVNTTNKIKTWVDEHKIANQVNNFIQVIKQNLQELSLHPPKRTNQGLLNDNYEEGSIFNLLELIETTPWTTSKRKNINQQPEKKQEIHQEIIKKQTQQKQNQQNIQPAQEMTDEQLQSEMQNFQSMMKQMLNLRAMSKQPQGTADQERKKKAEELITKLIGNDNFI